MTDDDIDLPTLPPFVIAPIADEQTVRDYARAAVLADRERRAKVQVKPVVHSGWIELFPDGTWTSRPGVDGYHDTGMMLNIRWTDDGRAWIDSKRNRELAESLRGLGFSQSADALDGGV